MKEFHKERFIIIAIIFSAFFSRITPFIFGGINSSGLTISLFQIERFIFSDIIGGGYSTEIIRFLNRYFTLETLMEGIPYIIDLPILLYLVYSLVISEEINDIFRALLLYSINTLVIISHVYRISSRVGIVDKVFGYWLMSFSIILILYMFYVLEIHINKLKEDTLFRLVHTEFKNLIIVLLLITPLLILINVNSIMIRYFAFVIATSGLILFFNMYILYSEKYLFFLLVSVFVYANYFTYSGLFSIASLLVTLMVISSIFIIKKMDFIDISQEKNKYISELSVIIIVYFIMFNFILIFTMPEHIRSTAFTIERELIDLLTQLALSVAITKFIANKDNMVRLSALILIENDFDFKMNYFSFHKNTYIDPVKTMKKDNKYIVSKRESNNIFNNEESDKKINIDKILNYLEDDKISQLELDIVIYNFLAYTPIVANNRLELINKFRPILNSSRVKNIYKDRIKRILKNYNKGNISLLDSIVERAYDVLYLESLGILDSNNKDLLLEGIFDELENMPNELRKIVNIRAFKSLIDKNFFEEKYINRLKNVFRY